jgi:MEMO1 family protein
MDWLSDPIIAMMMLTPFGGVGARDRIEAREAGVAGSFYPAEPAELKAMIDSMLAQAAVEPIPNPILAIAVPHAGYQYSGPVAAHAFATLKGHKFAHVVVIAPSHFAAFDFTSIYDGDAYITPLGAIPSDKAFAAKLAQMSSTIRLSRQGHDPSRSGVEHAIEVELPWLQRVLGEFAVVPIVMGEQSYENCRELGMALASLIQAEEAGEGAAGNTLIVASSDLSHYHPYDEAVAMDHKTLRAVESWDYFGMIRNFDSRNWEACGGGPMVSAMIAAERMGATRAKVLKYANSGDTAGSYSHVVGYGAEVFIKSESEAETETQFSLSDEEKKELLALARRSVERAAAGKLQYESAESSSDEFQREAGAFVTLHEFGRLRGCIGFTSAMHPLYRTVQEAAHLAAVRDPRFSPVTAGEVGNLEIEISVLSPLRRVLDIEKIEVGRHGLMMKKGMNEGLLLPQVPVEQGWDRQQFLEYTCTKAGLISDSWKDEDTDIFAFTAEVFGEQRHR